MTARFEAKELGAKLAELPMWSRALFAALCARRLAPAYTASGAQDAERKAALFAELHARLWRALASHQQQASELAAAAEAALTLLPPDEEREAELAEDAVAALAYALRAMSGDDAQNAVWAAERAYNAVDAFVQAESLASGNTVIDDGALLRHPLVQAELQRQHEDLVAATQLAQGRRSVDTLEELRAKADSDARQIFR